MEEFLKAPEELQQISIVYEEPLFHRNVDNPSETPSQAAAAQEAAAEAQAAQAAKAEAEEAQAAQAEAEEAKAAQEEAEAAARRKKEEEAAEAQAAAAAAAAAEAQAAAEEEAAAQAAAEAEAAAEAARVSKGEHEPETNEIKNLKELQEKLKIEIKSKDFNEAFKEALKRFEKYIKDFKSSKDTKFFDVVVLYGGKKFYIPKTDIVGLYIDSDSDSDSDSDTDDRCEKNLILSCIEYIHFMMGHLLYGDENTKYVGEKIGTLAGVEFRMAGVIKNENLLEHIKENGSSLMGFLKFLEIRNYYSMEKDSIMSSFNSIETLQ